MKLAVLPLAACLLFDCSLVLEPDAKKPPAAPDGQVEAPSQAPCCEDGLTWQGCCGTPSNPGSHTCGNPSRFCLALCSGQTSCTAPPDAGPPDAGAPDSGPPD